MSKSPPNGSAKKRLNLDLPVSTFKELEELASRSGRSMKEVMRTALGLVKLAYDEAAQGHKLTITSASGTPIKEIVLPK